MAIFGYGRVSTREQTTENQRHEIESAGYELEFWFSDDGVSGATKAVERPQFSLLLQKIRKGETLVVSKLDRLGRNALDVGETLRELSEREIKVIVLQLGLLDLSSAIGKAMLTMLSAVAELERDMLIDRVQVGLKRAKAEGKRLGRKPSLSDADRMAVREDSVAGISKSQLARKFGVSRATILRAVNT